MSGKFKKITLSPLPCTYSFFHNGSISRDSLPLRKVLLLCTLSTGLLDSIALLPLFHNGSISHDSVPLRCHIFISALSTPSEGVVEIPVPPSEGVQIPAFPSHLPKVRNRPGPSVAPVPAFLFPAASFHLPKVCGFSAFPSHLPKVRNRPGPSVAPVPAFLFPAASFHLPKVCRFPAFPSHLPKVRKSRIASKRSVVAFLPFMISSPSEGAGRNGILPPPSHFRYVPIRIRDGSRWSCHGSLPGRCRQRWHITVTFLVSLLSDPRQRIFSPALYRSSVQKVSGEGICWKKFRKRLKEYFS